MKTNSVITLLISIFIFIFVFWIFSIVDIPILPGAYTLDSGNMNKSFVSLKAVLFDNRVEASSLFLLFGVTVLCTFSLLLGVIFTKAYFSNVLSE